MFTNSFSNSFSTGASGLRAMQQQVDVHSANIANANTPGYRRRDPFAQTQLGGGVNNFITHRFNPSTAQRMSLLAGEASFFDAKAQALDTAEGIVSNSATDVGKAQNAFNEFMYKLSLTPSEPGLREQAAASARTLANVANEGLQALETEYAHQGRDLKVLTTQAQTKMKELADLNREAFRTGPNPGIQDRQAQVGRELAELIGGEVRFEQNGTATFMQNNSMLVYSDKVRPFPDNVGGKIGGLTDARATTLAYRDELTAQLTTFAGQANTLNVGGLDANGAPAPALFTLSGGRLQYNGTASGAAFAAVSATAGGASPAQAIAKMTNVAEGYVDTVVKAVANASEASAVFGAKNNTLTLAEEQRMAQEGVDVDQEMIALKLAERLYEASAKVIQTADSMLGTLLSIRA